MEALLVKMNSFEGKIYENIVGEKVPESLLEIYDNIEKNLGRKLEFAILNEDFIPSRSVIKYRKFDLNIDKYLN